MLTSAIEAARLLLADATGAPVTVDAVDRPRPHVARLSLCGEHLPASAILRVGPAWVDGEQYAGRRARTWEAIFANEWAGTHFLAGIDEIAASVPRVLAGDLDARLLVTEDVGAGPSLADLLLAPDPEVAAAALVEHARTVGQVAAATVGRTDQYEQLRAGAGPPLPASALDDMDGRPLLALLDDVGAELGVPVPAGLHEELAAITTTKDQPGPWLAYSPADMCPDNNVVRADGLRLFDFGFGGTHHLGLDVAYVALPFPTCWCYAPVPDPVRSRALAAYRDAAGAAVAAIRDDAAFEHATAWGLAAWFAGWIALVADRERHRSRTRGPLHARMSVVAQIRRVASLTAGHYPALAETAAGLASGLGGRWAVGEVPTYPAFLAGLSGPIRTPRRRGP